MNVCSVMECTREHDLEEKYTALPEKIRKRLLRILMKNSRGLRKNVVFQRGQSNHGKFQGGYGKIDWKSSEIDILKHGGGV